LTADQQLVALAQNQIVVCLDGDRLRYRAPEGAPAADMRIAINEHRMAIIEGLRSNAPTKPLCSGKCATCDQHNWADEPPKDGRIGTVCGQYGDFIGYRPANP
jgi:hypothetical protein